MTKENIVLPLVKYCLEDLVASDSFKDALNFKLSSDRFPNISSVEIYKYRHSHTVTYEKYGFLKLKTKKIETPNYNIAATLRDADGRCIESAYYYSNDELIEMFNGAVKKDDNIRRRRYEQKELEKLKELELMVRNTLPEEK